MEVLKHPYKGTSKRRYEVIMQHGGKCHKCGYDKCFAAIDFHHRDPSKKDPNWDYLRNLTSTDLAKEMEQCDLLCVCCHREMHMGQNPMDRLRRMGKKISRRIPFGSRLSEDGLMLIDEPSEQLAIIEIVKMREEGRTLISICEQMTNMGVKTVQGGKWYPTTVASILQRREKNAAAHTQS